MIGVLSWGNVKRSVVIVVKPRGSRNTRASRSFSRSIAHRAMRACQSTSTTPPPSLRSTNRSRARKSRIRDTFPAFTPVSSAMPRTLSGGRLSQRKRTTLPVICPRSDVRACFTSVLVSFVCVPVLSSSKESLLIQSVPERSACEISRSLSNSRERALRLEATSIIGVRGAVRFWERSS